MKKIPAYLIILLFVFPVSIAAAQGYKNKEGQDDTPVGMKKIRRGNITILVPEGQKITTSGGVTTAESFRQYVVKRFLSAEERLAKLEEARKMSDKEIEELKQLVADLRADVNQLREELRSGQEPALEEDGGAK